MSGLTRGHRRVLVGAGLAGLTAARDLIRHGARVTVADARGRRGGRGGTIRDPFIGKQHAESGGNLSAEAQYEIQQLAKELGLKVTRILRGGFGERPADAAGQAHIARRSASSGWNRLSDAMHDLTRLYGLAEQRWDSPIAADLARRSVAQWLDEVKADTELRETAIGLRGFFLADPEELSLLALVDQFASSESPVDSSHYRIDGGNDCLTAAWRRCSASG